MKKDIQYYKFCAYGFLKNLRFFDAFLLLYILGKGISYTEVGIIYGARELIINIFEIPSGIFSDSFGRKRTMLFALGIYISSFVIFYISANFITILGAFILFGLGDAFRSGVHKGMIIDYLQISGQNSDKAIYYGHTRSWSQIGSAVSALFAGFIVYYFGQYENIFLLSIIPYLLNFLLIMSYPKEFNNIEPNKPSKRMANSFKNLISAIRNPFVFKIMTTSAFFSAYLKVVKDYIQPLMISLVMIYPILQFGNSKDGGLFIGVSYFIIYMLTSFASRYSANFSKTEKSKMAYYTILLGLTAGLLTGIAYYYKLYIVAIILFIIIYIIENIRKPLLTGYITEQIANNTVTSVFSSQSQLKTLISVVIAFTYGLFVDLIGLGLATICLNILLIFFIVIIHYVIKKH